MDDDQFSVTVIALYASYSSAVLIFLKEISVAAARITDAKL